MITRGPFRFYQVPPPLPTYFGGTLPEVVVSSDDTSYPYYNELTSEERKYFNQNSPIGRAVRSIASTGKRGETANDLREIARGVEKFGFEMTGIPGSIRFSQDPVKKLKGLGRTVDATILGSSPFITAPYNKEDVADTFDALDAFGFATLAFAPLKTPLQQGIKSSGRYLTQGPLKNAYRLNPKALKEPNLILTRTQKPGQTADLARLDELLQKQKLTKAEEIELVKLSQPGYGRGFDLDPNRINYYANPNIQSTRKYSGMPEIRVTSLPAEEAAKFNVGKNTVKGYHSLAPKKEFLLPRNYVEASESFMPKTLEELDQLIRALDAEKTALSTPHWLRGYPRSLNTPRPVLDPLNIGPTFLASNMLRNPFRVFNSYGRNRVPLNSIGVASDVPASYGKANYSPEELQKVIEMANRDLRAFGESPYNIEKVRAIREEELRKFLNTKNYKSVIDAYKNNRSIPTSDAASFLRGQNKLYIPMGPHTKYWLFRDDAKKFADKFYSQKMTSPNIQVMSATDPYAVANEDVAGVYFPGQKRLDLFSKNERIYDPKNRLGGDVAYIVDRKARSGKLLDMYLTMIHEGTHGRAFRLGVTDTERKILYDAWKDIIGDDGIKLSRFNPMGRQVSKGKYRSSPHIQQFETEALQGELRMLLNDKDGSRIYSEKDIPEIKRAIKNIAKIQRIAYLSDIRKSPEILDKIDLKPLIKSLNKIGFATTAPYVATKLPDNNKE